MDAEAGTTLNSIADKQLVLGSGQQRQGQDHVKRKRNTRPAHGGADSELLDNESIAATVSRRMRDLRQLAEPSSSTNDRTAIVIGEGLSGFQSRPNSKRKRLRTRSRSRSRSRSLEGSSGFGSLLPEDGSMTLGLHEEMVAGENGRIPVSDDGMEKEKEEAPEIQLKRHGKRRRLSYGEAGNDDDQGAFPSPPSYNCIPPDGQVLRQTLSMGEEVIETKLAGEPTSPDSHNDNRQDNDGGTAARSGLRTPQSLNDNDSYGEGTVSPDLLRRQMKTMQQTLTQMQARIEQLEHQLGQRCQQTETKPLATTHQQ